MITSSGFQLDVRVIAPDSFGAAWQYFTGSKEHNVRLREMAVRQGFKINEYGVFRLKTGKRIAGKDEREVYAAMKLPWIPPEIREDAGEIQAAQEDRLPHLVELADIKGDCHMHTNASDGRYSLQDVAQACRQRGYQYAVITDHSQSLKIAKGLDEARLRKQVGEIKALNERLKPFQLLMGAEVDILAAGRMDFSDTLLSELDFVVGSIHSGFKQAEAVMTDRIITAMRNPYVCVIAHPTGRLIGQREPYAVNLEQVYQAAKATGTALEINAHPKRLDLEAASARRAKQAGARLVISTDTHSLEQLPDMEIGVGLARRAWLEPSDILNCLTRDELIAWVRQKRATVKR